MYSFRISVRLQSLLQSFHNLILRSPIIDQDLLVEWGLDFIRFMNQPVSFDIVYFIQPTMVVSFITMIPIFDWRVKVPCLDFSFQMNWYYHFFLTYPTKLLYLLQSYWCLIWFDFESDLNLFLTFYHFYLYLYIYYFRIKSFIRSSNYHYVYQSLMVYFLAWKNLFTWLARHHFIWFMIPTSCFLHFNFNHLILSYFQHIFNFSYYFSFPYFYHNFVHYDWAY